VKCCPICQKEKIDRHDKSPLGQFNISLGRFENLHVDLVWPLPPSNGFKYILTVIDRVLALVYCNPFKGNYNRGHDWSIYEWVDTAFWLSGFCSHWSRWTIYQLCLEAVHECFGIKHVTTISYHPQSNALVENLHRRLKDALRMQKFPNRWHLNLPLVALVIRTTMKEDYPCSPAELVYGQDLRLPEEFKVFNVPTIAFRDSLVNNLKEFIS